MSKRQVIVLWIVALVLGVAVATVKFNQRDSFSNPTARDRGETLLEDFPAEQVTKIEIADGETTATLVKTEDGWTVAERENFPASFPKVAEFLRKLGEVKVTQGIEAGPRSFGRFGVETEGSGEDRGTTVVFSDGSEALATIVLGKRIAPNDTPDPLGLNPGSGRFVRHLADESGVYVVSEVFPDITANPREWLQTDLVRVEKIRRISVTRPEAEGFEPWTVVREAENAEFALEAAPDAALDAAAVAPLKYALSNVSFEDLVSREEAAEIFDAGAAWEVTVETFEGLAYSLRIAPITAEGEGDNAEAEYALTLSVQGEIAAERRPGEDESEADKAQLDEAFAKRRKELQEKLDRSARFEDRTFKVTRWAVDSLLKTRDELVQEPETPESESTEPDDGNGGE